MKKIMFILAFAGIGLFASASNGKIGGSKPTVKKALNKKTLLQYSVSVYCPGAGVHTGCCWNSAYEAYAAGVAFANSNCGAN